MIETICSNCNIDLQKEKEFFENPNLSEERYCMKCAVKKATNEGLIKPQEILEILFNK